MVAKGYKNTEIGVIPKDWDVLNIMTTSTMKARIGWQGLTVNEYQKNGDYYLITGTDFCNGKISWDTCHFVKKERYEQDTNIQIKQGDILITKDGTIGKIAFVDFMPLASTLNSGVFVIRPQKDDYSSQFMYYVFNSVYFESFLNKLVAGSTITHLYQKDFVKFNFPLPHLSEQNAIATALSDADALISSTEKLIAKKKAIKQGAMQELLKPKEGWETIIIDKLGKTFGGLSGKSRNDFENGNCPYIPFMNIMSNAIVDTMYFDYVYIKDGENQNKAIQGDLFFNTSSETPEEVGMCSVLLENIPDLYLNSFCFGFRLDSKMENNGLYLSYFFRSSYGRKLLFSLAQGATRHNLSKNNFLKTEIQLPKPSEQTRIATILSDMDTEISLLEQKLEKQKQIKQGMMQNLLTGKIRLLGNKEKQVKKPKHNKPINEAVVISFLVHKFGTEKYPLSRFRYTKYAYLLHRQSEREARGFDKHAAGPYNPANRYKGAEGIALKNKYIAKVQNPTSKNDAFVVNKNIERALNYFTEWYGTEIPQWIEQFKFYKNEYLEVLTTVDKAICDLAQKHITIDVQSIKAYISSIPQWKKKLEKPYFSDKEIQKAINESNRLFGNG